MPIFDVVYDGFGGSGSTLIAAHKMERQARLIELSPIYCDTIWSYIFYQYDRYNIVADMSGFDLYRGEEDAGCTIRSIMSASWAAKWSSVDR